MFCLVLAHYKTFLVVDHQEPHGCVILYIFILCVSVGICQMYPIVSVCIHLYPGMYPNVSVCCIRKVSFVSEYCIRLYPWEGDICIYISVYSKCIMCLISACVRLCSCHFDVSCLFCIGISVCAPLDEKYMAMVHSPSWWDKADHQVLCFLFGKMCFF